MIVFEGLRKYRSVRAVADLSFEVRPGRVTALLGPNGAGKTTSLRILLGLTRPDSGSATFDGRRYHQLTQPIREVGSLIEQSTFHPVAMGRASPDVTGGPGAQLLAPGVAASATPLS